MINQGVYVYINHKEWRILIMKKLIMFVMVLAIVTPSLAEEYLYDLYPPPWAGAAGTLYGTWDFTEEITIIEGGEWRPDAAENFLMVAHATNEIEENWDAEEEGVYMLQGYIGDVGTAEEKWHESYDPGGGVGIREGVLLVNFFTFDCTNFVGDGTKVIRLQLVHTGDPLEGVEVGWEWSGGWDEYWIEWPPTGEIIISENPAFEWIGFGVASETPTLAVDQAIMDTICYNDPLPTGPGREGSGVTPAIVYDPNITTIYEPEDPELYGPKLAGPVVGNIGVKLGWQPVEVPGEPPVTVLVTLDPNTDGDRGHDDYKIWDGDPVSGTLTLTFDANNYDVLQKVNIEAIKDTEREGGESYALVLTSVCNEDPCFQDATANLRINVVDNDVPSISALPERIELSENTPGVIETIEVRLTHAPTSNVEVFVGAGGEAFSVDKEESAFKLDPNLLEWMSLYGEPNRMTFTPHTAGTAGLPNTWTPEACEAVEGGTYSLADMISCWNVPLTINVQAIDNDVLGEEWVPFFPGEIEFEPLSEDLNYLPEWLNPDGTDADNPATPDVEETSDGLGDAEYITLTVEDNDCGAWGYPSADVAGGEEGGPDCHVGLADLAAMYIPWLECTEPYDGGTSWVDCCAPWHRCEDGTCPGFTAGGKLIPCPE
jgi:hypothetical protein